MKYKKCVHDKCRRKAEEGSAYCKYCTQLPAVGCLSCSNVNKRKSQITNKNTKDTKSLKSNSKHNNLIDGLISGGNFFGSIYKLGRGLFLVITFLTVYWVWATFYVENLSEMNAMVDISLLMLSMLKLCMWFIIIGLLFKYFCIFLADFLYQGEVKELLKIARRKYLANGNIR